VKEISEDELEEMREESQEETKEGTEQPVSMSQRDFCPNCGQPAENGAIQMQLPIPVSEGQVAAVALPMLACARCGSVYMPRSFLDRVLNPPEEPLVKVASPRINLP